MKLRRITISSYRSLFDFTSGGAPLELECSDGMNLLIGPNNCGKSNVVRAIELALEPEATISAERDLPGNAARARPAVVLQFQVGPNDPAEDLVRKVQHLCNSDDKQGSRDGSTTLTFRVRFERDAEQGTFRRRADFGFKVPDDKRDALDKAVRLFHERVRFVITRSGESLESILEGKFREVLRDVVSETLRQEYEQAIGRRESYLDDLQAALFKPLTDQVAADLSTIFPEVNAVELRPNIPEIDATIANLSVQVADSAITDLASKGTGLRGGVIAAMFRYLATHSRHSMVFAVEEPESFLHPAAQESLRENLEQLAERDEITVIATTHSPFMVPRRQDATLFALTKDASGATRLEATARGDEQRATLIGGLFRDPQVSYVLDSVQQVPPDAVGVLVVEGTTDVSFHRTAARLLGRRTLDGVHLVASSGAGAAATQALVLQAGCSVPVCALFDNDDNGKTAFDRLRGSTFGKLIRKGTVLNYRVAFPDLDQSLPFESEDLFSTALHAAFAERYPEGQVVLVDRAPGVTHPEFHFTLKEEFAAFVESEATAEDCERWHRIFDAIDKALGRPVEERPPRPASRSEVSPGSTESAAVQRPTAQPTPTALEPPDPPKSSERRRPTPLESELNGSKPETRRVKELFDEWAAARGVEVEAKGRSYGYLFNKKIVTRLWPAYNAIDAHLDHLDDSPASAEIRAKIDELSGKLTELTTKKRQVGTSHVVANWEWFRDVLLDPRRQMQ